VFINLSGTQNAQATDTLNESGVTTIGINYLVKGANGAETVANTSITVGTGTSYSNTANGLMSAINGAGLGLTASFGTQTEAGVQGGGTQTGIIISGGLVSVGVNPGTDSTSGIVNLTGTAASELLTQGQSITLQTGTDAAVTVAIDSSIDSLSTLAQAINKQDADVNATVITNGDGTQSLSIADKNPAGGALVVNTTTAPSTPISVAFSSGGTGVTGGYATGTLGFGGSVTSSANEVIAGSIVLSNNATPGAAPVTFVMGTSPAQGTIAGTLTGGSTYTVNGNTLGNLATAIAAELGVSTSVSSSGIAMTSTNSGTTLEEVGTSSLTATPSLSQTGNVAGVASTNGTDGATTLAMNGSSGLGFGLGDALNGSIVITNGNADAPGTPMTFVMGTGALGYASATNTWTTATKTVGGLVNAINDAVNGTGMSASLNPSGQIVMSSTTVGTTIAVSSGAVNNTLVDSADTLTVSANPSTPSAAAQSTATMNSGVSEINGNPVVVSGNDTLNGSIILTNGTTNYTFGMAGSGLVAGADKFLAAGNTLSDLANAITAQDGATDISAAVNSSGTGLIFTSVNPGISIGVTSSALTDVSGTSFTTPASGSTPQHQSGVIDLTDGGLLPGSGGAAAGTLSGTVTITNDHVTDTFVMGGSSLSLAADGGTITVNGSTVNDLIAAVAAESAKTGSNLDLSASLDVATGGAFLQSTISGSTGLSVDTSALTDTLAEGSVNGANGEAGATVIPANLVYANAGVNSGADPVAGDVILTNTPTSGGAYGGGAVTFAVGSGAAANTIYTGTTAADETLQGLANTINSYSSTYNVTASVGANGLTITSLDPTSTLANGGGALNDMFGTLQTGQLGGANAAAATYATATVGTTGTVGANDVLSNSIVLSNTYGGTTVTDTFTMGSTAGSPGAHSFTTGGTSLQDLATAINQASIADNLDLNATVANGVLDLQSTQAAGSIMVGNGTPAGDTLTDTLAVSASAPSTGGPGAKSTATLDLAGGLATANAGDTMSGSIKLTGSSGTEVFTMGGSSSAGTIAVGNSAATETLEALADAISGSGIGINATVTSTGLSLTMSSQSSTPIVESNDSLHDTAATATLTYNPIGAYSVGISNSTGANTLYDSSTGQTATDTDVNFVSNETGPAGVATISYSDGAGASLAATDLLNQTDAQNALTALNIAITDVAAQDGYIGAQINTLNSISQVMSTQQENVVSAQNAIQATDYASATSNMSKYEILSQTGIAALAQANSVQQEVTKLLQ
jgi:flagellin